MNENQSTILDKNVEKNESTGNYKYFPYPPPPKKKHNVEVQLDNLWLNNFDQGGAKDGGHSSTKIISEIGVLYVRKCKILNTLSKIVG